VQVFFNENSVTSHVGRRRGAGSGKEWGVRYQGSQCPSAVKECNIQQVALPASHPSASAPTEICNTVDCDSHSASIPINIQQFIAECREGAALEIN
jgi:hypothetical protein